MKSNMARTTLKNTAPKPVPKTISVAFSGSGFLAPIHAGAACAFLDSGYTFKSVSGTSGGSIVAGAIATGMTQKELRELAIKADFSKVLRISPWSILTGKAYCNGDALLNFLASTMRFKSFSDLNLPCKIIATDLEYGVPYVFSKETTPSTQVGLACRASSAVPYIYESVQYGGKVLVDGGVVNNIPIAFLDKGPRVGIAVNTSGKNSLGGPIQTASALISILLSANEGTQELLAQHEGAGLVTVDPGNAWFLDTNMSSMERFALFTKGYQGVKNWLATQ